jgi:2,4-dienoyl-CoA reductase-like NADH-dependent reductase (Old Yellow Enzyme family)
MTKLFEPIKIGKHELKHRIVHAPLTRYRATTEGIPTELMAEYYKQRTTSGGLLITEAAHVSHLSGHYGRSPRIHTKEQIAGWKKIADAIHQKGGIVFLQLFHLGRVQISKVDPHHRPVISASAIRIPGKNKHGDEHELPRALEVNEIKQLVQEFKQAALNAIEAGFDGVELHSANGYLLDQFINSGSNQRTDEYGGSIENRARFPLEVVDAVVDAIGPERTAIRFSPGGSYQGVSDEDPVKTWSYLTSSLQEKHSQLAYVHFIEPRSSFLNDDVNTADSLDPFRKLWKGPFITAGGFSTAIKHAVDVAEKTGNLIAFGRIFIANPDLPERIKKEVELNRYDRDTFYTGEAVGYTDYPFYKEKATA